MKMLVNIVHSDVEPRKFIIDATCSKTGWVFFGPNRHVSKRTARMAWLNLIKRCPAIPWEYGETAFDTKAAYKQYKRGVI
ncbi:MAG: hypothetical protein GY853_13540 [PVC group bacterium]|nr:hypothetical protein [PVC group bacterium]